ncbi:hypothetical protein DSM106972_093060 [Dulcicalothrix desertica PCC 7102]|uniref:Uncharacterized protein n=1 Tax=Dulcicalothrix desertica PCC 7102 TaxID=232991 RepID=A0A3S1AL85_9CYAN|nr:hypothetical protein [Dulcicalothrix desertica]RUS94669.1 hypothetical protein DSM106972_093060 [Dulcicalothrix desertica PCC 7102]TWH62561.1 hypothetical protein CAL7102_00052 [Dulcicalothrix desertica PCC 7102]
MALVFVHVYIPVEKIGKLNNHTESLALEEIEMSRVPCVGEFVRYKGYNYKVDKVIHNLDFDRSNSLAIVNPEAFIHVSLCDL